MSPHRYNGHKIDIKHNHFLKYKYLNSEINLLFSYLFPRKMKIYALAGLLTYSRLYDLPVFHNSGLRICINAYMSLQQRDCSGFTPDSLFITIRQMRTCNTNTKTKI
jgi:hypothetical protein